MAYDFDTIAKHYDRMNHLMTLGMDRRWRRHAVRRLALAAGGEVLDVACGTGDMVVVLQKQGARVTGVDLSEAMLALARRKVGAGATLRQGDAEALPFEEALFDAVTCAFGVRNFVHLDRGLSEMARVLRAGGQMLILEMATPDAGWVRPFYNFYTRRVIPMMGKRLAGNREAYSYLPASIERFPKGEALLQRLAAVGIEACQKQYFFGVCRCYLGTKIR